MCDPIAAPLGSNDNSIRGRPATAVPRSGHVVHNYHDHSGDVDEEHPHLAFAAFADHNQTVAGTDPKARGGIHEQQVFPVRLHYVLTALEKDGLSHIASWQPHGRCFVVHDRDSFVRQVLPFWFSQKSFASFQRQCNLYGFKRLTASGPDKGGYYHELFLQGMPFLAQRITRTKIKNNGRRKAACPEAEPNFYKMTAVPVQHPACRDELGGGGSAASNLMSLRSLLGTSNLPQATAAVPTRRDPEAPGPELLSTNYNTDSRDHRYTSAVPVFDRWTAFTTANYTPDANEPYQDDPYDTISMGESDYLRSLMEPILDTNIF